MTEHLHTLETGGRGGGCNEEFFSCEAKLIHTEKLHERKNIGIGCIAEPSLGNCNLSFAEEPILAAILGNNKFCHLHSCASSFRNAICRRCCALCDLPSTSVVGDTSFPRGWIVL